MKRTELEQVILDSVKESTGLEGTSVEGDTLFAATEKHRQAIGLSLTRKLRTLGVDFVGGADLPLDVVEITVFTNRISHPLAVDVPPHTTLIKREGYSALPVVSVNQTANYIAELMTLTKRGEITE